MPVTAWKTLASRYLIRDSWLELRADRCETASGFVIDPYYVQEPPDWVQVVAFDHEERILITRQYRHGAGMICAELPCGTVEPGETAIQAMRRELLEETGCETETLHALPVLSPNPARYTNRVHPFIATGTRHTQTQRMDPSEDIEFEFLPIPEVLSRIDQGAFLQALHIGSLFLALRARDYLIVNDGK
jgi:8-oxo-dGTP pyrophosphatase MutT (NUDIX family)